MRMMMMKYLWTMVNDDEGDDDDDDDENDDDDDHDGQQFRSFLYDSMPPFAPRSKATKEQVEETSR